MYVRVETGLVFTCLLSWETTVCNFAGGLKAFLGIAAVFPHTSIVCHIPGKEAKQGLLFGGKGYIVLLSVRT